MITIIQITEQGKEFFFRVKSRNKAWVTGAIKDKARKGKKRASTLYQTCTLI